MPTINDDLKAKRTMITIDRDEIVMLRCKSDITENNVTIFKKDDLYVGFTDENKVSWVKSKWGEWINVTERALLNQFLYA